jgi:hypothetical protein
MKFDRIVSRLIGTEARAYATPVVSPKPAIRGSGSWANEWMTAELRTLAAKDRAVKRRLQQGGRAFAAVRPRVLMETGVLKLHEMLTDRIEAESPTCTLHSAVAFHAFLVAERPPCGTDRLAGLQADLLVADAGGRPLVAILREDRFHPERAEARVDVLMDAAMPFAEMREDKSFGDIWSEVSAHLPRG